MGHKCCQREIFREWNKGFRCNKTKFFLSFFLFLPVFFDFFVRFDHYDVVPPNVSLEIRKARGVKDVETEE